MKIRRLIAASLLLLAMMSLSSVALAQPYPPKVKGDIIQKHPTAPDVGGVNVQRRGSTLPFTGADAVVILLVGFALIGTGTVLVRRFRVREEI